MIIYSFKLSNLDIALSVLSNISNYTIGLSNQSMFPFVLPMYKSSSPTLISPRWRSRWWRSGATNPLTWSRPPPDWPSASSSPTRTSSDNKCHNRLSLANASCTNWRLPPSPCKYPEQSHSCQCCLKLLTLIKQESLHASLQYYYLLKCFIRW